MRKPKPKKLHSVGNCKLELVRPFDKFQVKVTTPNGEEHYFDYMKQARDYARSQK